MIVKKVEKYFYWIQKTKNHISSNLTILKIMKQILFIFIFTLCGMQLSAQSAKDTLEMRKGEIMQNNRKLHMRDVAGIVEVNPEAFREMRKAYNNQNFVQVFSAAGGFLIGWPIGTAIGGGDPKWELLGIGAGLVLVSIPFSNGYKKHAKKAIMLYNEGIREENRDKISFNFQVTASGVGMVSSL